MCVKAADSRYLATTEPALLRGFDLLTRAPGGSAKLIGAGTTELHVVRPLGGLLPEYILLFLKSSGLLRNGEAVMTGSAGQKRVPRTYFESTPCPLPPRAEQCRIVARVEELMKLCNALEESGRLADEQHGRLTATDTGHIQPDGTLSQESMNSWAHRLTSTSCWHRSRRQQRTWRRWHRLIRPLRDHRRTVGGDENNRQGGAIAIYCGALADLRGPNSRASP